MGLASKESEKRAEIYDAEGRAIQTGEGPRAVDYPRADPRLNLPIERQQRIAVATEISQI